jgi:hypothetical protein
MKDPIISEIRRLRALRSIELAQDVRKATQNSSRKVFAMATNVVWTGPHSYRATFRLPSETNDKPES